VCDAPGREYNRGPQFQRRRVRAGIFRELRAIMANAVTRVVLRCEDALESGQLGEEAAMLPTSEKLNRLHFFSRAAYLKPLQSVQTTFESLRIGAGLCSKM